MSDELIELEEEEYTSQLTTPVLKAHPVASPTALEIGDRFPDDDRTDIDDRCILHLSQ